MRKIQKKQAENLLKIMKQVHNQLGRLMKHDQIGAACDILVECQHGAIVLGNLIEQSERNRIDAVSFLEEYCEMTYQLYEQLADGKLDQTVNMYKNLHKLLIKIENSIQHDIKVRSEIVFLPYKASMWDSLESVWRAADADPDCDAYVIPIPYYDKNPDGSFGQMHYEGAFYPSDVPVMRYQDYDLSEKQPDIIFIHNPYDEYNYVTSVEPFYYSKNLKKYTKKLVYIPYYIVDEGDPKDRAAVNGMKSFCTTPGVFNADKVVVQSENMRQIYINVMMESTGCGESGRKYWEDKILGLGSPKIDKVQSTKKEELEIPEEWMDIIRKPDGSWKKIVFYNTGVSALLQYNEQMLFKMQDVFRIFKEKKENVALLWRPHPLIQATIESMRPELWKQYKKIVAEYRAEKWGIYDDSADMNRAVALSDAYFGDQSSVKQLYSKTKKPVMIQNVEVI